MDDITKHYIALAIYYTNQFAVISFLLQILIGLIIRYMTIFHQSYLNDIDDERIVAITRLTIGILALISSFLTGFNPERPPPIYSYQVGIEDQDILIAKVYVVKFLMVSCIIAVVFVQIKVEIYEKKFEVSEIQEPGGNEQNVDEEQNNQHQEVIEQKNKTKTIRRVTFCIIFALAFYIFLFVYYRDQVIAGSIFPIFLTNIILQTTLTIVIPVILIFRNENMFTFCINYLWKLKKKIKA